MDAFEIALVGWIPEVGAVGVLFAVLLMVFTGRLVPRSVVKDIRADRDARVTEAREETRGWKSAYVEMSKAYWTVTTSNLSAGIESVRTVEHMVSSLPVPRSNTEEVPK